MKFAKLNQTESHRQVKMTKNHENEDYTQSNQHKRLKVIATAYTIDPYQGSEAGVGWNFTLAAAKHTELEIWTRINNRKNIENYISKNPGHYAENIRFRYFDLHENILLVKKKMGTIGSQSYYLIWNLFVALKIKSERKEVDIYHCINFHTDWIPHFLYLCSQEKPIVWGPIGHHEMTPLGYLKKYNYPLHYIASEIIKSGIKNASWRLNPLLKKAIKTSFILPINDDCIRINRLKTIKSLGWSKIKSVASEEPESTNNASNKVQTKENNKIKIVFVGRFVPMKGLSLVIECFSKLVTSEIYGSKCMNATLTCIGTGPCENMYKRQAFKKERLSNVVFIPWMSHAELKAKLREYDILLFPSFEGAGMIVIEAMLAKCVCMTLDNNGPGETIGYTGYKVRVSKNYSEITEKFRDIILMLCSNKALLEMKKEESKNYAIKHHLWENREKELKNVYEELINKK